MKKKTTRSAGFSRILIAATALAMVAALLPGPALAANAPAASDITLTLSAAQAIALEAAGLPEDQVVMTLLKLDRDDGLWEFEVEFVAGGIEYEYDINAETGAITKASTETAGSWEKNLRAGQYLTMAEAQDMALAKAAVAPQDAAFTEIELDFDDGRMVYELAFTADGQRHQAELDAETGEVLQYRMVAEKK